MLGRKAIAARWWLAAATMAAGVYYLALISAGFTRLFGPENFGLNFNNMLAHMLRGAFDVDADMIRFEGFARDGKIYSYFGPFMTVPRLLLLPFGRLGDLDITRLSSVAALAIAVYAKLATLLAIHRRLAAPRRAPFILFGAAIVLGGPTVQFLPPSMYQEVADWAHAFAAIFVLALVPPLIGGERFGAGRLAALAAASGLALATRGSIGTGLCLATGLLLLVQAIPRPFAAAAMARALAGARTLVPLAILAGAGAVVGYVNYQRWGNPLVFADMGRQLTDSADPTYMPVLRAHGVLNVLRIPFNFQYYFFPIWILVHHGRLIFHSFQAEFMMLVSYPPSTPLLTDPALVYLAGGFALAARRGTAWGWMDRRATLAVLPALALPALIILMAGSNSTRYRVDYVSFLEITAFLGFALRLRTGGFDRRAVGLFAVLVAAGVVGSHLVASLQAVSSWSRAELNVVQPDLVTGYYWRLASALRSLLHGPH